MKRILAAWILCATLSQAAPVPVIFDTDMGNDVDDVVALAALHALQDQDRCEILAVTVTKAHPLAGRFVERINAFKGHPKIPVGVIEKGPTPDEGRFLNLAKFDKSSAYPNAVSLLRKTLAAQPDNSVVIVQTGFFTNLAHLLDSPPDEFSDLSGVELARKKVRLLSVMAGAFQPIDDNANYREYNITHDIESARTVATRWPSPRLWSGFEIGKAVPYPHDVIERQFKKSDPLRDAYYLFNPPPHDRPNWDATAVIAALMPNEGFFHFSPEGIVTVEQDGVTIFREVEGGPDRFLILDPKDAPRLRETIVDLSLTPAPID
jgi:inosine-uridine nucleoside N-ribohydrolase